MADPKKPQNQDLPHEIDPLTTPSFSPTATVREEAAGLLKTPQLPDEFIRRIENSEMMTADGQDLKEAALGFCRDINELLVKIARIPGLDEATSGIKEKLKNLTGETLKMQISQVLEELTQLEQIVTDKATDIKTGADYLQNTEDGPGTPRVDLEAALVVLQKTRPVHSDINQLGLMDYVSEREKEVQKRMDTRGNTQFVVRYMMQRNLEEEIAEALENGEINERTSQLILKASSGQMNMAFNVVGQRGAPLYERIDEDDLGTNEAERQFTILDVYWHLLGAAEGFRFIKRFYE